MNQKPKTGNSYLLGLHVFGINQGVVKYAAYVAAYNLAFLRNITTVNRLFRYLTNGHPKILDFENRFFGLNRTEFEIFRTADAYILLTSCLL